MKKNEKMKREQTITKTLVSAIQKPISVRESDNQSQSGRITIAASEYSAKFNEEFWMDIKPAEMLMGIILPELSNQLKHYQEMKKLNQK